MGAWPNVSAAGVRMVAGGPGSRWRARILRTTSAEWTPWAIASAQAASTAGSRPSRHPRRRIVLRFHQHAGTPRRIPHDHFADMAVARTDIEHQTRLGEIAQ